MSEVEVRHVLHVEFCIKTSEVSEVSAVSEVEDRHVPHVEKKFP